MDGVFAGGMSTPAGFSPVRIAYLAQRQPALSRQRWREKPDHVCRRKTALERGVEICPSRLSFDKVLATPAGWACTQLGSSGK